MSNIETPGALIGGDRQRSRLFRLVRRKPVRIGIVLLLIACAAFAAWYVWYKHEHQVKRATATEVTAAVNRTVMHPNYAGTEAVLDDQLRATTNPKSKAQIYLKKSSIDLQQSDYKAVIEDQTQAVKLDPSLDGVLARTTADAYMQTGDKARALEYYKKAKQYFDAQPNSFSGKTYYENYIKTQIAGLEK